MSGLVVELALSKTWSGPTIDPRWRLVAETRIKEPAKSIREIAGELGLNYQTVLMWTKKPLFIAYENWLVDKRIEELSPEASPDLKALRQKYLDHAGEMQDRLLTIIETTPDAKLQREIAVDWLDRANLGPPRTEEKRLPVFIIPERALDALVTRAVEAGLMPSALPLEGEIVGDPENNSD